ncbi:tyrosine-type recombinase/integrase [Peribacillus frigoritolerans]|uniref:tyrosine-type recombinase/integrase n=1 Tax=Peribacillus frigoritolerans TaxID=450367 RepID=UPI00228236B6|nr:site-specific integrase [Peribacillus frigoritolerans]MCY8938527.1 site-specific integrase [Peribacillus frigoritolerans]
MDKIIEYKGYFGVKYKRIRENRPYKVMVAGITKKYNDFTYMMVIGTNGLVYFETYKYLNGELENEGFSKRELALRALKLLYSYLELFSTEIKYLDVEDKNKIIAFLQGGQGIGRYITYDFKTIRKNDTVNTYLGVYRSYLKYLGIKDNIFAEPNGIKKITASGSGAYYSKDNALEVQTYSMNLQETKTKVVPKYIKYSEYLDIKKLIEDRYTLREKIIVKLMYEYGLRIGEVLGLTLEDIQGEQITKQKGKCRLILRNRFTDKPWQYAKGRLKVTSREVYNNEIYDTEGAGYRIVSITPETFDLIQEYIDDTTSPFSMSDKAFQNYSQKNIADKVSQFVTDRNAYVFISKNYTPISGGSWNKIMKEILQVVGIKIDQGKKTDNLNHRFRHGFAMYKVLHEGFDLLKLAHVMRHSNPNSSQLYFNPTEGDLIDFAIKQDKLTKKGLHL